MSYLQSLREKGFDESVHIPFTKNYRVKCSQCEALTINNIPTHETGCPNFMQECRGCSNLISYYGFCENC